MTSSNPPTATEAAAELDARRFGRPPPGWRRTLYIVIFESDTPAGLLFDKLLLVAILASVGVVMLDSSLTASSRYHSALVALEWMFTGLFTIEYVARLACVERPWRYTRSFFGIVDLVSVLPTWLDDMNTTRSYGLFGVRASSSALWYGARSVRHSPASADASGDNRRLRSAHSETVWRGGGSSAATT